MSDPLTATGSLILKELAKSTIGLFREFASKSTQQKTENEVNDAAAKEYLKVVDSRYNTIRIFGMDKSIPLRDIYVTVNVLAQITAGRRLGISDLQKDFDFDRKGFGIPGRTLEGSSIVSSERYRITDDAKATILSGKLGSDAIRLSEALKKDLDGKTFVSEGALLEQLERTLQRPLSNQERVDVAKKSHLHPRNYIVLGKPGAGKTTFLKYLTLFVLDGKATHPRVPMFISLRAYAESDSTLLFYITNEFNQCNFTNAEDCAKRLLLNGTLAVFLDGLDEVNAQDQERVIRQVLDLSTRYPQCQFVISCRVAAYNYWFPDFTELEIADFSQEQIRAFVKNWFREEPSVFKDCISAIEEKRQIREVASNPLLLTLLCITYDSTLGFPQNRAELYSEAIDALLRKWDVTRRIKRDEIYKNLSSMRKESLLSRVAADTFEREKYFLKQRELQKLIGKFIANLPGASVQELDVDGEAVLKAIEAQHGFFVERAKNIYSFSHLTFQEYFTAKYYVDSHHGAIPTHLVKKFVNEPRWREVCLLTAGLLDDASRFFQTLGKVIESRLTSSVKGMFRRITAFSLGFDYHPQGYQRALLVLYMVHHAQAVLPKEGVIDGKKGGRSHIFSQCIENVAATANLIGGGSSRKGEIARRIEEAVSLAQRTEFPALIADEPVFCLRAALGSSRSSVVRNRESSEPFPISELLSFSTALRLSMECLTADCYLKRELREKLVNSIFDPDAV